MQPGAFETATGRPVTAVTAAEMRAVDRVAVEEVGVSLLMMMENAGQGLASAVAAREPAGVTVLAGDGGNGGGGLACARHLANHGLPVAVVLDRPADGLTGAAARQHRILEATGVASAVGTEGWEAGRRADDLVVDALVGYGLDGPLRGEAAGLVARLGDGARTVVSLDVPSGLDPTSGEAEGPVAPADAVVTLALPKTGLLAVVAELLLADIGLPAAVFERLDIPYASPFDGEALVPIEPARER